MIWMFLAAWYSMYLFNRIIMDCIWISDEGSKWTRYSFEDKNDLNDNYVSISIVSLFIWPVFLVYNLGYLIAKMRILDKIEDFIAGLLK